MSGRAREILIPPLAAGLIRSLYATLRIEFRNREVVQRLRADGKNYIHAFWHGRLLLMPYSYSGKGITLLISKHGDGELLARAMQRFGFDTTRGSTSEGAVESFKALVRKARAGFDIAFTPDGPRGPRYSVTAGPIQLARMTGLPIVPVAFAARNKKEFASWDRFQLPAPFTRAVFQYGEPILVPHDSKAAAQEQFRLRLERELGGMNARLDAELGDNTMMEELRARGMAVA